jgi:hypothetical protein
VIVALTTVIAPEWRRIRALDGHFAPARLDIAVYPVSSDSPLSTATGGRCGQPRPRQVVEPARSAPRAASARRSQLGQVQEGLERRRVVLAEPSALAALEAEVAAAVARIEHLRGPGARWSIALGDRMADLSNDAGFQFRGALRDLMRSHEEAIESLKSTEQ